MTVFQSSTLINSTLREMWGEEAPTVQNISELVTLGETIISSDKNKELFINTLTARIKRTVIRVLDLALDMPYIFMDNESYFGILQKINVAPLLADDDNSWNISQSNYETTIWEINKPIVTQKFFNSLSTFTIPITIPDVMLKPAFLEGMMDGFITAIFNSIEMSIVMCINALSHLAVCNLIAENVASNKEVNLLSMYNTQNNTTLTASKALYDLDFLRFAGMILRNYIHYMQHPTKLFNDGTELRGTLRDNMHVLMLTDFYSAYTTYYTNDTFHNELAQLPFFSEVTFWQNMGNTVPSFTANSTVNVIPASEAGKTTQTPILQNGVICVMADRQAIGTTLVEDWSGVDRNNRERYSNYTFGANRGYFNDLSENSVVFVIADTTSTSTDEPVSTLSIKARARKE